MKILITRPEPKATELSIMLKNNGIDTEVVPLLDIHPIDSKIWQAELAKINAIDALIFVSTNAVECFMSGEIDPNLKNLPAYALGQSTATLLKKHGFQQIFYPSLDENSEALLQLPQLQNVLGQRFLIIRGTTGREFLAKTLKSLGAHVEYLPVYQNHRRDLSVDEMKKVQEHYDLILLTSTDALKYFLELNITTHAKITVMAGQMQQLAEREQLKNVLLLRSFSNQAICKYLTKSF
jgi:uroporphyrinogen-III synthase